MSRQTNLGAFANVGTTVDLDLLTPAEKRVYVAVRMNGMGVREHARATNRTPGTVGNLLARADDKLGGRR